MPPLPSGSVRTCSTAAWIGNALYGLKRYGDAEAAYREAIRLDPDNAVMHRNLGKTLYELKP